MPIKVVNIILEGRFGGPQNQILQVAERLKKYGIETIVVIPKKDSDFFYSKLIEKNIKVKRLKLHRLTKHKPHLFSWLLFFIPELLSLYKCLKEEKIRLVHCNCSWQIKGVIAGKLAGKKVIWHLQDTLSLKTVKILFKIFARFCDGFIVAGNRVRQHYLNSEIAKTKKVIEIQAPVDTSIFKPNSVKKDKIMGNNSALKIITVGNINPEKGFEYFIEMANILSKKYKNLYFCIVGSPLNSDNKYLEKLNQLSLKLGLNNILFYGESDSVPSVLKAADIFVCSSVTESSPMSIWEAMAMEKAIVSTDVGDVSVYIKNGKNGFIVPHRNAYALAEKVSILIEDEKLRLKLGKIARATAIRKLDVKICAEKHKEFYLWVLNMLCS